MHAALATPERAYCEALLAIATKAGDTEAAAVMALVIAPPAPKIGFCREEPRVTPAMLASARKAVEFRLGASAMLRSATVGEA